jgi:hypothetical protein
MTSSMHCRHYLWILLLCLGLTGCGGIKYGEVTGTVTYKGKPLPGGTIHFWPQGPGAPAAANLHEDGTYTATVPVGDVTVTIETESLAGRPPAPIPRMWQKGRHGTGVPPEVMEQIKAQIEQQTKEQAQHGKYVKIESKFSKPETSGIKTTIHTGTQEVNVELQ